MELPPPGNRRVSINNPQETSGRVPTTPAVFPTQPSRINSISSKRSAHAYRPSIMSNRSSGAQSLLPNPVPHKGSLVTPSPLQSKASNISSVRYADEEGKQLQEKDKDQDKGKGRGKGAGTRLLTMLKKTLQGSQSDEIVVENQTQTLIPFGDVVGCLAIHIKSCRQFSQRFIVERHFNLFIRVSINHIVKCTKLRHLKTVSNEKNLVLRFDEVKYFSVQVPRRQDDERNYIYLELMEDGGDPEKPPFPLGGAESHLYEVIQKGCFTEIMQLMRKNSAVCRVEVEFMFSYGNFGYGFSHQLKPLQKLIEPSMFMNIAPPPERTDPVTNVITPQRVEYPAFLSPEFNVNIGIPETSQATMVQLEKLREKPRERLEKMKEEYRNMNTWIEKADYLRNLINPKMVKRDTKGNNEPLGSNSSILEELERTTYDIHHRKSEAFSNELMDYGDKEGRVIPVLKLLDQNFSETSLSKSDDSMPQEDVLLPPIHTLQIIEEDEMPHLQRTSEPEERPREERKSLVLSSDEELMPKHPSILKIASSQQESKRKIEKSPHFSDVIIIPDKPLEELNTNKKGRPSIELRKPWERRPTDIVCSLRKVAFAQKEYTIPVCKSETTEFKPKHQFQKLSKSGLDPFLRNINSKMSFRKKKDHDNGYRHLSTLSTELLEHEDQDPPYPEHLGSAGSDTALPENPSPFTVQMANKNSLPPDPITATKMISDRKNKLSLDSAFNSANNSNTKSIFASDNPVVSLTKLSDSDNKLLTDSSFNTTKSSNRRLSRDSNSNTTKPSDTKLSSDPSSSTKPSDRRLSSDPSSGTTKPSDTKLFSDPSNNKLSRDPSSNATQLSGSNRLSYNPSINGNKSSYTSDLNRVSHDPSIISTKSSDPNKLSRDPSIILAKSSDPSKLSRDFSIISTRSSDPSKLSCDLSIISTRSSDPSKLSYDPSIISMKSSDPNKLSRDSSIISAKVSDPNKLSSDPSVISTKSSDPNKLSHDPSINSTRLSDPTKLSRDPSIISAKSSDPNKLSRDPSINSTRLSDPSKLSRDPSMISHDPSIISAKSDPSKLSHDPSINSTRLSDPSKLSHDPSIISAKSSDANKLSRDPSIISAKSSDANKLSRDPSVISAKSSDANKLSRDPSVISAKSSDANKLSRDPSVISAKSSDANKLSRDPSVISAKSSDANKLSRDPSVISAKSSDANKLSRDPSVISAKSSDANKLSRDPSVISAKSSDANKLSRDPSVISAKSSDANKLSRDPSVISAKSSDANKLSRDPSVISAKSSDANKLSRDPSVISAKSSDANKLSRDPSVISAKSSDANKLSRDPSVISAKSSDANKLSRDPSVISAKSSDANKLSRDPSVISAKSSDANKLSRDPSVISAKSSDANKLSRDPSVISAKSSDANKLSRDPSVISAKSSDANKLSRDPSVISAKSSDANKLSRDPSVISAKSSDPNKLSRDPSINSTRLSDPTKLSHDPSIISTKLSDPSNLSHDSNVNARKCSDTNKLSQDLSIISTKSLDSNNRLPSGNPTVSSDTTTNTAKPPVTKNVLYPDISTVDSSDKQNKLEWLPNISLSNVQGASSVTENVNIHHPSSSINFTSDIEILKQSIVLKSILSKNLQDLSDELFSKPEVYTNDEGYSLPPSVHSKPSDSTDNRVFEKVQDLNSWRSSKDLLNSQVLLSPVVKRSPQDLFPEGEPGKSSDIEEYVSEKLLEAAERNFPMNRKSSFKKKHLVSEESGSERVLNGSIYEYVIKQIFTAPIFSQLGIGTKSSSEGQMDSQHQLLAPWDRSVSSQILNYDEKGNEVHLSQSKSVISQIIQSFPVNTLLESGIIKVIELDKEHQSSLLDSQTTSSTEQYSDIKSQIKLLSRQNTSNINHLDSSVSGAEYTEDCQSISTQESKYPIPFGKSDSLNEHRSLDTEETELSSNLESSSSSLDKVKDSDTAMLKSVLKNIFSIFFKYNHQSERRQQPEKESESLIKHSSSSGTEHLEKNQENFNKADKKVDRKPILNPKLRMFLEKLSETEVKNLKSELSKHIQHYLVERLTESGHITKEDLPTIYHKLYLMNEKAELKEQSPFQEKYSETVREIMSFVNNFNHHFIDKHLETKLRGFLSEILQNYFLKNLSVSNLFNETDAMALHASMSPVRSNSELGQDIADGNFGSSLKINMKCPVSKSLQNYLQDLSENELLSLKTDLSKYLQVLFIEKLYKSGLVSEGQLKGISQEIISLQSPPIPLKHIKTNLPFRNESYFMREDSEEQKKYSKNGQNTALQTLPKDKCEETELSRKEERESSFSLNLKESLPTIWEQKTIYTREEETLNFIEMQSFLNKNNQANPLTRSPERPSDISLKKQKKDHGFMQFTQVDSSVYKTEIQDPYSWDGRSKTIQSKSCFEKTLKMKQLDKRESNNFYKLNAQEKLDTEFSPYLKLPNCKVSKENDSQSRLSFPTWQTNTFIHVKPEIGEQSKLDHYYQRLRGNNNNNKKHLVTFAQFKNEMETLYRNPYEACNEKRAKISESQSFKYKENEKNSRPFFFPEVLKRENIKSKRKERDHATKPKKSFHKIVRLLPATLPTTRPHLRKSVPRNLLHWTARRTIHDCLDRFDDLHAPSVKCPKKSKSRARLLGKSPDDSHNQAKHCARPYTAPEPNKRRESAAWKFASPRMVSAGLVHFHASPEYEVRRVRSKRKLKEDIEKRPLISEIIQMLDTAE
ncbi:cation channel sperm-associated targeting subunit tau [Arvicanthis niloticus]|uniref:cation channel sperm-associated targeting subunit tau n=1 Tax=Arvicanthis niloticus TaxID=61156 RepID=UPI00402BA9EE